MAKFEHGKEYRSVRGTGERIARLIGPHPLDENKAVILVTYMKEPVPDYIDTITNEVNNGGWTEVKKPQTIEAWINVWKGENGLYDDKLYLGTTIYDDEKTAISYGKDFSHYVDTIKIEYTEKV